MATSSPASCAETPRSDCATPLKASIVAKDTGAPLKRALSWKWMNGSATLAEFGDPVTGGATYRVCLYDDGVLQVDAAIDAGGMCGTKACWSSSPKGLKYKNKAGNAAGISEASLKTGVGKASISVKAKGTNLADPFPFTDATSVVVQLVRNPGGPVPCWGSTFPSPPKTYDPSGKFGDKVP
jgi:hypothetical protein